ncbi:hypothetical protein L4C36_23685 [Photobacterium japonica]|uniref:hypothetical protein n=1 Tax=Photobacterium japonica TaxID=2910235 RepID=UPI003D0BD78D
MIWNWAKNIHDLALGREASSYSIDVDVDVDVDDIDNNKDKRFNEWEFNSGFVGEIEKVLAIRLSQIFNDFDDRQLRAVDITVFPWYKKIEMSFLVSGDDASIEHVRAWEYFDYLGMSTGSWEDARVLANEVYVIWNQEKDPASIFNDFGRAATSQAVTKVLNRYNLSADFIMQVKDPDDRNSPNYCE